MAHSATPTPWRLTSSGYLAKVSGGFVPIESPYKELAHVDELEAQANNRFILKAANAHDVLVNAAMGAYSLRDKFPCDCGPKVGGVCAWCGIKTELKDALELAEVKR